MNKSFFVWLLCVCRICSNIMWHICSFNKFHFQSQWQSQWDALIHDGWRGATKAKKFTNKSTAHKKSEHEYDFYLITIHAITSARWLFFSDFSACQNIFCFSSVAVLRNTENEWILWEIVIHFVVVMHLVTCLHSEKEIQASIAQTISFFFFFFFLRHPLFSLHFIIEIRIQV